MPVVEIEVDVWCSCGQGLCNQTEVGTDSRGKPKIMIEPCERCLDKAKDEGFDKGYEAGYDKGFADGGTGNL